MISNWCKNGAYAEQVIRPAEEFAGHVSKTKGPVSARAFEHYQANYLFSVIVCFFAATRGLP